MNRRKTLVCGLVVVMIVAAAAACAYVKTHRKLGNPGLRLVKQTVYDVKGNTIGSETIALPGRVLNYRASTNLAVTLEELGSLPKDTTYGRRIYEAEDKFSVFVSVVMMGADSRSIHKPEFCLPSQGWKIERSESTTIPVELPQPYRLPIMKLSIARELQPGGARQKAFYLYWFVAEDQLTADHFDRMWRMGKELLRSGTLQRWSYVALMAQCLPGQEDATYERLTKFIAAAVPTFQLAHSSSNR